MKRILILGASGRTGKYLLEKALQKGYMVNALVRNPEQLSIKHQNLVVLKGSPYNLVDVEKAITGTEAVLVALNNPRKTDMPWAKSTGPNDIIAKSVGNALKAMKENNIKRIVVLSAFGVGNSFELNPWITRFFIRNTNLKVAYQDHEATEQLLKGSDVNWTAIKPVALSNSITSNEVKISYNEKLPLSAIVSRLQVAEFMLNVIDIPEFFSKTPTIS